MVQTRALFFRALGAVTAVAFVSFGLQAEGLIGVHGILPYGPWLEAVEAQLQDEAYWRAPTLLWWAPGQLHALWIAGLLASLGLLLGMPVEGPLLLVCGATAAGNLHGFTMTTSGAADWEFFAASNRVSVNVDNTEYTLASSPVARSRRLRSRCRRLR